MKYHFSKEVPLEFDKAVERMTEELKREGFVILAEIDMQEAIRQKLDVDFPRYRILGALNPALAHQALQVEEKIGLLLPHNLMVREIGEGVSEVAAIDPMASMHTIENLSLGEVAQKVQMKLMKIIDNL
jgi:uncharacterized protein (DUF302 family)